MSGAHSDGEEANRRPRSEAVPSAPLSVRPNARQESPPSLNAPAQIAATMAIRTSCRGATLKGTYIGAGPKASCRHPSEKPLSETPSLAPAADLTQLVERYSVVTPTPTSNASDARYVDRGFIGEGGMGYVRRVYDRLVGRHVAMKILSKELFDVTAARSRFFNEARIAANLQHPGIIAVHDFGELSDGRPFFTMKEVHGRTFGQFIEDFHSSRASESARGNALRKFVEALKRVCEAVAYAHEHGFIHRDLKPQNLMMGPFGEVQVVDWGLAIKLGDNADYGVVSSGSNGPLSAEVDSSVIDQLAMPPVPSLSDEQPRVAGTYCYMPPEQGRGELQLMGPFSDVYALGAVLYHMLCGYPPYLGEPNIALALHRGPPLRLSTLPHSPLRPSALCAISERAMGRAPDSRYQDAGRLARALEDWMNNTQRHQRATTLVTKADRLWRGEYGALLSSFGGEFGKTDEEAEHTGIAGLRERAEALRQQADTILGKTKSHDAVHKKKHGWTLQDQAQKLEQRAAVKEVEWQQTLRSALNEEPENEEAHRRLASFYRRNHEAAERVRDREVMARTRTLLSTHDRGVHRDYLQGQGHLSLVTDPPGALIIIQPYQLKHRRLQPGPAKTLGVTPLYDVRLNSGSYVLTLRAPGHQRVRYPVRITRDGSWSGIRPGGDAPYPIRLPRLGMLGEDDILIPGGWFLSGGDPDALESLPSRDLWVDDFVIKRHPVTRQEYQHFLNTLVDEGKPELARRHAPKNLFVGTTAQPAWPRNDAGYYQLDPTWKDEQQYRWPVSLVDWTDACAYARWLSTRTGQPWRLPSEVEWEKAARGTDGRFLPWGDFFDPTFACVIGSHDGPISSRPVSEYKRFREDSSPYGVRGMAGNVRDWCLESWQHSGPPLRHGSILSLQSRRINDEAGAFLRSARGGCWISPTMGERLASRFAAAESLTARGLGFRLVYSTGSDASVDADLIADTPLGSAADPASVRVPEM